MSLIKLLTESGSVKLHRQGTLSNERYCELKSARKMIKNYIKDTDYRIDIYDALSTPKDKFVYTQRPDSIYVEATNLLDNTVKSCELYDKAGEEPVLRKLFKFVDKINNPYESRLEEMKRATLAKYKIFLRKCKNNNV